MLPINKKLQLILGGILVCIFSIPCTFMVSKFSPKTWQLAKIIDNYCYDLFFKRTLRPYPNLVIIDSIDPDERLSRREYAN